VAAAEGSVAGFAMMVDQDGKTIGAGAQSNNGMSAPTSSGIGGAVTYTSGRAPAGADEVAVDAGSAEQAALRVGDRIRVVFRGPPQEFTVAGIARFGDADRLGSTTTALFDLATAQQVLGKAGSFDEIRVRADDGVTPAELRDSITSGLPSGHRRCHRRSRRRRARRGAREHAGPDQHFPHGVRRHRRLRRVVHHLEHLHDPGGPAHP
jgi:putative ABC transport system permease protein